MAINKQKRGTLIRGGNEPDIFVGATGGAFIMRHRCPFCQKETDCTITKVYSKCSECDTIFANAGQIMASLAWITKGHRIWRQERRYLDTLYDGHAIRGE